MLITTFEVDCQIGSSTAIAAFGCETGYIARMQLELFSFDLLSDREFHDVCRVIRNHYWYLRNLRGGVFGQARRRKCYRLVAAQKKRLQLAGVPEREILALLACCRLQCTRHKHPFEPCKYCRNTAV
jgi:hypothetical protein